MISQQIIINEHDIKYAAISRGVLDVAIDIDGVSFILIGQGAWLLYMKLGSLFNEQLEGEDDS